MFLFQLHLRLKRDFHPKAYHSYIQTGGFDYLYDKVGLYDSIRRLMEGGGNVADITRVWQVESGDIEQHMLRFLENHDEQRIASKFFARNQNAFAAVPGMTVSATLGSGPVMYYFGQEVGEPAEGSEGFSTEDGRTTMFDWWGVPHWQGLLNAGKFDGGGLTGGQRQLLDFYRKLNLLCRQADAIKHGRLHDLQYAHTHGAAPGYADAKLYTYVRYSAAQTLLFVASFDHDETHQTVLKLPQDFLSLRGWPADVALTAREVFLENKDYGTFQPALGLPVSLPPNSVRVFEIGPAATKASKRAK